MAALIGTLLPGEERRLRNRAMIRWRLTAGPAARTLAELRGVTSALRETAEGLYAEVAADGRVLVRYRIAVHAGRGSLRDHVIPRSPASPAHVLARSAALRTRSAQLAGRSLLLRGLSAAVRTSSAGSRAPVR